MINRGRKSSASLAVVPVALDARRPSPPKHLKGTAEQLWRDTVKVLPGGWFNRSIEPLLESYCRHVATADWLGQLIDNFDPDWVKADGGLDRLNRLLSMRERETRAIVSCARSLRMTPQSQMHPRTAGRATANETGNKPWD